MASGCFLKISSLHSRFNSSFFKKKKTVDIDLMSSVYSFRHWKFQFYREKFVRLYFEWQFTNTTQQIDKEPTSIKYARTTCYAHLNFSFFNQIITHILSLQYFTQQIEKIVKKYFHQKVQKILARISKTAKKFLRIEDYRVLNKLRFSSQRWLFFL